MNCPRCHEAKGPRARFCAQCGASLGRTCVECGTELSPAAKFCHECGRTTSGTHLAKGLVVRESGAPQHPWQRSTRSRGAHDGERKQVTVLFADLKGSMQLLMDRDPEDAQKILDPVLELMMEAVHRYEGTVNQVMGDGIMALFGAPLAHEDDAVRACYAALRMQERIGRYGNEFPSARGHPIQIRVGLNTGEVVVRSIGNDLHTDYTAVGQTAHLAARMEQMAEPGAIFATVNTFRLTEGYVQATPCGGVVVKGLDAPVEIYMITGIGPVRWRLEAAAARGLTRFVGRDAELSQLGRALGKVALGHGQIVGLVGDPGVGKSRLFYEFTHSNRLHGWSIHKTGAASYDKSTTYLPFIDLLKSYFEISNRDAQEDVPERVAGKVLALDEALTPTLPALLALLHAGGPDPRWEALDPRQRRQRIMEAVRRLLFRESQVQPLCLVFEDLHWIDNETQALLDSLVDGLPAARLLLLVNYRPEYHHGWAVKSYYTQLSVKPLPPGNAEELLDALVGDTDDLGPLKQLLIERTEGNPFFLEESIHALVETKALTGQRGAYRLAKRLDRIQVPASVQAVLASRIDRLSLEDKAVLETASVIGKDVPFALLQAIAGLSDDELRLRLEKLQAGEFLYEVSRFPDLGYTFKHALTHEVACQGLLHDRRRALHTHIVEALERLHPDRLSEHLERLAYHARQGEVWEKAVAYFHLAGIKASARSANRQSVAFFEQALEALTHLPDGREKIERSIDLRFGLRTSLTPLGEHETIAGYLREAERLAETLGDPCRVGRVSVYMSDHLRLQGDHGRAIDCGSRALAIAEKTNDLRLRAMANSYLGLAHYARGDYRLAPTFFQSNLGLPVDELGGQPLETAWLPPVHSRAWLASCLAELGEFQESAAQAEKAVALAQAANHAASLCVAYFGVGQVYLRKGDPGHAIPALERGLELSRASNFWLALPNIAAALGSAYALAGRMAQALRLLGEAVEQSASMKRTGLHSARVVSIGEAYLLAGLLDDASALAQQSLRLARDHNERGCEAWALRLLGEIGLNDEGVDEATVAAYYDDTRALAEELGMRPLLGQTHLGLGRLYRRTGRLAEANQHLLTAAALFRDMGMAWWRERTEAELARLPTPS